MINNIEDLKNAGNIAKEAVRKIGRKAIVNTQILGAVPFIATGMVADEVVKDSLSSPVRSAIILSAAYLAHKQTHAFFGTEMHFPIEDGMAKIGFREVSAQPAHTEVEQTQ